jgi:putative ABC transport system permease protein
VVGLVLRQGMVLAGLGIAFGVTAAFGVTRLMRALLFGLPPTDAFAFGGAAMLLVIAALAASWMPARRAAAVEPSVALRAE